MSGSFADDQHITRDPAYRVVAPDDFPAMIEVDRYDTRSDAFDGIIGATHDHFWDPFNPAYLDYATPFDVTKEYIMPPDRVPELQSAVGDRLDGQKIRLANNITRCMSGILHGEQGAMSLSARCATSCSIRCRNTLPTRREEVPRRRLRPLHQGALGHALSLQPELGRFSTRSC